MPYTKLLSFNAKLAFFEQVWVVAKDWRVKTKRLKSIELNLLLFKIALELIVSAL